MLLRGLGEYKRGGGGDRGRFLALWTGAPWAFTRVGSGGKAENQVKLRIKRPTLVVCGGLQTRQSRAARLRGRRAPRRAARSTRRPCPSRSGRSAVATRRPSGRHCWSRCSRARDAERGWHLDDHGRAAFEHYRRQWKQRAREVATAASMSAALDKADVHTARVALVLAEAQAPGAGGPIGAELVNLAATLVGFTLGCWPALPEQGGLALSHRNAVLDSGVAALAAWLEERGGKASRRELQRACVAGARTADDLKALLDRYEDTFPGTVAGEESSHGGLPAVVVSEAPSEGPRLSHCPALPTPGVHAVPLTPLLERNRALSALPTPLLPTPPLPTPLSRASGTAHPPRTRGATTASTPSRRAAS